MKTLIALVSLIITISCNAGTLTATDSISTGSFVEFIDDPTYTFGPDYAYSWIATGDTLWVDGVYYTGPCWVVAVFDVDWNTVSETQVLGYSVELVSGVALGNSKVNGDHFYTWEEFISAWLSVGGGYVEPIPFAHAKSHGKGHKQVTVLQ